MGKTIKVANLQYEVADGRWKKMGSLYYSEDDHRAYTLIEVHRQGRFIARAFPDIEAPYISGDIMCASGGKMPDGRARMIWCGYVITSDEQRTHRQDGVLYTGELFGLPIFALRLMFERASEGSVTTGIFMPVYLEDHGGKDAVGQQ